MFADYITLVVRDYRKKTAADALPLYLMQPTPARLRDICLEVCNERHDWRKDEGTLAAFFGRGSDKGAYLKAIERCDIDKFRPLVNFLKESTGATDPKNIELLAWLIDFKPRPFEHSGKYDLNDTEDSSIWKELPQKEKAERVKNGRGIPVQSEGETDEATIEKSGQIEDVTTEQTLFVQRGSNSKKVKIVLTITIAFAASIVIYWLISKNFSKPSFTGHEACMFWADDHYEQVSCNQRMGNTLVIALDSQKLVHLRKITRPDTITINAIGTVWYVKYRGNLEYYTSDGYHPIDQRLRLKPITAYMIRTHIFP
ncbi:MAG TPA: hypothetical protein VGM30_17140 [Puia sp.]